MNNNIELIGTAWNLLATANDDIDEFDNEYYSSSSGPVIFVAGKFTQIGGVTANRSAISYQSQYSYDFFGQTSGSLIIGGFNDFDVVSGHFFATGEFEESSFPKYIGHWDGAEWDGIINPSGHGYAVEASPNIDKVLFAGAFSGYNNILESNISSPYSVSAFGIGFNDTVFDLAYYNNELYAAGKFTMSGTTSLNYLAKLDSITGSWVSIGGNNLDGAVLELEVFENELYISGIFGPISGDSNTGRLARWDGSSFKSLSTGISHSSPSALQILKMRSKGEYIYIGGAFDNVGGITVENFAMFNGTSWSTLGAGIPYIVSAIEVSGEQLFVGTLMDPTTNNAYFYRWE
ncbi:MAG: hypothetical protein JKY54_00830 [Flavobacteriales bacterium]|nr:hypothetical protein [Flavobacteriales bacterium]